MKRLIIFLAMAITLSALAFAQDTAAVKDSVNETGITYTDRADDESTVTTEESKKQHKSYGLHFNGGFGSDLGEVIIPVLAISMSLGMPIIIVFISLFFNYKNRRAKYKLAEQALAAGQPIPESLFKENINSNIRSKGIKNIFLGLGLTIFLWAITTEFGVATIGLLVLFTGLGQLVVSYSQERSSQKEERYGNYANRREIEKNEKTDDFSN